MPKGIYAKSRNYRKTEKLTGALTALKGHDPYFQVAEHMTNDDIFAKLKGFGFVYRDGQWKMTLRPRSSSNGHKPTFPIQGTEGKPVEFEPVTITAVAKDRLEMCLHEDDLGTVQQVIDAMHVLGFKVEVKIVGKR